MTSEIPRIILGFKIWDYSGIWVFSEAREPKFEKSQTVACFSTNAMELILQLYGKRKCLLFDQNGNTFCGFEETHLYLQFNNTNAVYSIDAVHFQALTCQRRVNRLVLVSHVLRVVQRYEEKEDGLLTRKQIRLIAWI